jgi:hypothetical protein
MSQENDDVFQALKKLVEQEVPPPRSCELSRRTELQATLRMAAEDAEDFLSRWFTMNQVNEEGFEFTRYFPSEGLWLLPRMKKQAFSHPISLGMLELAAKMKRWDVKVLEDAYLRNDYSGVW